jgi:lantibiotic biosynthesis protein
MEPTRQLPGNPSWRPVLCGPDASRAQDVIESIAATLGDIGTIDGHGVGNGAAGVALFYAYLHAQNPTLQWRREVERQLCPFILGTATTGKPRSFLDGDAGVAWAMGLLEPEFFPWYGGHLSNDIDAALLQHLDQRPWRGVYDFSHGLVGYALYALDRRNSVVGRQLLERTLDRLTETAVPVGAGVTWWCAPQNMDELSRRAYPSGYFNLGLAHGVPGIISVLGQASALDPPIPKARGLLDRAVNWLLEQRNAEGDPSCYPNLVPLSPGRLASKKSRVAWCYGDLGLSAALYLAAVSVEQADWAAAALEIARNAARRDMHDTGVRGAGVCHGSAGNGHIFNRLYQATHEQVFLDAACAWLSCTLTLCSGTSLAWMQDREEIEGRAVKPWPDHPGFFGGLAGIGLVLLAATSDVVPTWDKLLLAPIPPRH